MYKKRQRIYKDLALNADEGLPEFPDEGDIGQEKEEEGHASDDGSVNSNATHQRSEAGDERSSEAAGQHDQVPDGGNPDTAPTSTPPATTVNKREEPAYRPRSKIARMKTDKPVEIGYRKGIIDSRRQEDGIKKAKYDPGR